MQKNAKNSSKDHASINKLAEERPTKSNAIDIPNISLPKGGGALKGIDEKFQVNAANGTASFSIPLPFSQNRNGFTPQLTLSYNSGTGNSLFGIGWGLDLPSIQRSTDKKLPRYRDSNAPKASKEEDSFMFSGVEELVPLLDYTNGTWAVRQITDSAYTIRQYRPRIESGFSRIERIWHKDQGYYWRVTSRENITTFFGFSPACRIADPTDPEKIFQWLPEFSFDDKGSWARYTYKVEDLTDVATHIHEKNRFNENQAFSNKHLKIIQYGNRDAYYWDERKANDDSVSPYRVNFPQNEAHFFDLVFDYGEHETAAPSLADTGDWPARKDPYSTYRSCFEIRSWRLCRRVLMFHHFEALGVAPVLVRSIDFEFDTNVQNEQPTEVTYLTALVQKGYIKKADGSYSVKALPATTFDYQCLRWNKEVKTVRREDLLHAPVGLSGAYQWVDLYNEGINGLFSEQADAWYYKSNLGEDEQGQARFSPAQLVMPKPSFIGIANGVLQLQDLEADGLKQIVVNLPGLEGYFELSNEGAWQPFKAFAKNLNLDLRDPNVRMLDVNGDGRPEVVLSDLGAFWYWENEGKIGYDAPEFATKPYDEEHGPVIVFADSEQRIFLADMSGDGLTDIVRIRNGEVCYWPNLGYGRFGAKVTMDNAPLFDYPERFNPAYLQLADISGTGATDIIYLGKNQFRAYLNFSGNAWSDAAGIEPFFSTEQPNNISVVDLLGNGTGCIVWSSEMPAYRHAPMRYIDLMGGKKPHIMVSHENGFGKKTVVEYKSSTHFYLKDKEVGTPWVTKLAFPVQVVSKTIVTDEVTKVRFTAEYTYHHGYYDHAEREFRGFGRVDQTDTESFDVFQQTGADNVVPVEHHQAPVLTKTWFHTGAFLDKERMLTQFRQEYWYEEFRKKGFTAHPVEFELPDAVVLAAENLAGFDLNSMSAAAWREALRACKGMTLRQEVFGLDADKRIVDEKKAKAYVDTEPDFLKFQEAALQTEQVPYSVATHNCEIQVLQERVGNRYAAFIVKESEAITYTYERNPEDPRIAHTLNIETDELGNVLESVSVVYPRRKVESLLQDDPGDSVVTRKAKEFGRKGQEKQWITFAKNSFTNDILAPENYYLRKGWQTQTYELIGLNPTNDIFTIKAFKGLIGTLAEIQYFEKNTPGQAQKRLIEHAKTKYYNAELTAPLPDGQQAIRGVPFETYQLAYTSNLLEDIFTPSAFSVQFTVSDADMQAGKFAQDNTNWWIQSGTVHHRRAGETLADVKNHFFAPVAYTDPFDSVTEVFYDPLHLFMQKSVDALANTNEVLRFNFRMLSPDLMQDMNHNLSSIIVDELGLVKAMALEGKAGNNALQGEEADDLLGLKEISDNAETQLIQGFFELANTAAPNVCNYAQLQQIARSLLGNATTRMVYDFSKQPTVVATITREQHAKQNPNNSPLQISFEYTDGLSNLAMKKVQAEAGMVKAPDDTEIDTGNQLRWVGNGRTVLNNKGNPIKQYEPYFSTTPAYENDPAWVQQGVTPILYYDGAGRNVQTELPNGTFIKVLFDAWKQWTYDVNDTVLDSQWYAQRQTLANNDPEKKAAQKSTGHANTPSLLITDTLGRPILGIDHNRWEDASGDTKEELYYTTSELDIEGNALSLSDARGNVVMAWRYDLLGHRVAQTSMDAGKRWMLHNVLGNPVKVWDERQHEFSFEYDDLHRPTRSFLQTTASSTPLLTEVMEYGEHHPAAHANNLRGQVWRRRDGSGQITHVRFNFQGQLLEIQKQMPLDAQAPVVNWINAVLESTVYTQITEYDAMGRTTLLYNWHYQNDQGQTRMAVNIPQYSSRGTLESMELVVDALKTPNGYTAGTKTTVLKNLTYDAKGQRTRVRYGNGTTTCYHYEEKTFRLIQLRTTRINNEACPPQSRSKLNDPNVLQNLFYTYDPIGNIIDLHDDAFKPVFFNGQRILPQNTYTYNALYQLIEATGREHHQLSAPVQQDADWPAQSFPISDTTLRGYTEQYKYDSVGNILKMQHVAEGGSWTRHYQYATNSNRLLATEIGSSLVYEMYTNIPTLVDRYTYDEHGNMTRIGNLSGQRAGWDYRDMIQSYDLLGGGNAYYQYDNGKERSRKYLVKNGGIVEERLYLGGLERYRRWRNNQLEEEIETLHVAEGQQRLLLVENVLSTDNPQLPTGSLYRYQMSNHLGSVSLELDENSALISYEEYHPYGTTAYQARSASVAAVAKRYRYTGMERDEESGLSYHSARYYLPWLGRWASCDPLAWKYPEISTYCAFGNNPIIFIDENGKEIHLGSTTSVEREKYVKLVNDSLGGAYKIELKNVKGEPQLPNAVSVKLIPQPNRTELKLTDKQRAFIKEYKSAVQSRDVVRQILIDNDPTVITGSFVSNELDVEDILQYDQAGNKGMSSAAALIHETIEQLEKSKSGLGIGQPAVSNIYPFEDSAQYRARLERHTPDVVLPAIKIPHEKAIEAQNRVDGNIRIPNDNIYNPKKMEFIFTVEKNGSIILNNAGANPVSKQEFSSTSPVSAKSFNDLISKVFSPFTYVISLLLLNTKLYNSTKMFNAMKF